MNDKLPQNKKIWQLMECVVPNVIGLYVDSYFGCALSLILLLWQWNAEKSDRMSPVSRRQTLFFLLPAIALSLFLHTRSTIATPAIAPPPPIQQIESKRL